MQPASGGLAGGAGSLFGLVRRKPKPEGDGAGPSEDSMPADHSEETKRRVEAAKSYIENMYKVQYQNIQERYAR